MVEQLLARGRTVNSSKHQTMLAIAAIKNDDTDDIVQKKIQMTAKFVDDFAVYGQINVYGVTTKSERHKRSYWTRTADGNGIGGRKAPVPYGS